MNKVPRRIAAVVGIHHGWRLGAERTPRRPTGCDCLAPIEAIGAPIKPALPQCRSDGPAILREDHVEAPRPSNNAALTSRRNLAEVKFHVITSEQLPNRFHQMMGRAPTL